MNNKNIILVAALSISVAGCTCREEIKAYVKDSETHQPIKDVTVRTVAALKGKYREGTTKLSDSNGRFVAQYDIANVAKCPVTKVFFTKAGYEDKSVIEPQNGDTIFLNKIQ
jgi:type IV pilus biogenesis protein CpaD/CtpE